MITPGISAIFPVFRYQEYKPMIFANGQRVQFPGPTKVTATDQHRQTAQDGTCSMIPQKRGHTEGVLTVTVEGPVFIPAFSI